MKPDTSEAGAPRRRHRAAGKGRDWEIDGKNGRDAAERLLLADEAARILIEQGLTDFERARRKAAERIGIRDRRRWPDNAEIEAALLARHRLFRAEDQARIARELLVAALGAMRLFAAFDPKLIGAALNGTADRESGVELLLFADAPEEVLFLLMDRRIPWRDGERILRSGAGERQAYPTARFMAGTLAFTLILLPSRARRQLPLDPITDRPYRGADLAEVERLLTDPIPTE